MDVLVREVTVFAHENADSLEIVQVDDYQCVVRKGDFWSGDRAVYIPEGAIVPDALLVHMGLTGKLAGSQKNRVKAVKLRGVVSQGLLLKLTRQGESWILPLANPSFVVEGQDVTEVLGITKHVESAPRGHRLYLAGNNVRLPDQFCYVYDIENLKRYPSVFTEYDDVVVTEKIHGSLLCVMATPNKEFFVASKGLLARGVGLETTDERNAYVQAACLPSCYAGAGRERTALAVIAMHFARECQKPVMLFGELFGVGVQKGFTYGQEDISVRLFDIRVGYQFVGYNYFVELCERYGMPRVPVLYVGAYNRDMVNALTNGLETVSGTETHIREGVVVKCKYNSVDRRLGRKILKSVSADYLLRKNGSDYQ